MGSGLPQVVPRKTVYLAAHRVEHQLVIGGMELHFVNAPAIAIESVEHGFVAIGLLAQLHLLAATHGAIGR
ncbi:hypothetical protein D3C87_1816530 [compost metagenome]